MRRAISRSRQRGSGAGAGATRANVRLPSTPSTKSATRSRAAPSKHTASVSRMSAPMFSTANIASRILCSASHHCCMWLRRGKSLVDMPSPVLPAHLFIARNAVSVAVVVRAAPHDAFYFDVCALWGWLDPFKQRLRIRDQRVERLRSPFDRTGRDRMQPAPQQRTLLGWLDTPHRPKRGIHVRAAAFGVILACVTLAAGPLGATVCQQRATRPRKLRVMKLTARLRCSSMSRPPSYCVECVAHRDGFGLYGAREREMTVLLVHHVVLGQVLTDRPSLRGRWRCGGLTEVIHSPTASMRRERSARIVAHCSPRCACCCRRRSSSSRRCLLRSMSIRRGAAGGPPIRALPIFHSARA